MRFNALLLFSMIVLTACNGGGGPSGPPTPDVYGSYSSPSLTVNRFLQSLNENESYGSNSYLLKDIDETERQGRWNQDNWFVIYDDRWNEERAISLEYIRSLVYMDYYSNNPYATAAEYRRREDEDMANGHYGGDEEGDYYEATWGHFSNNRYMGDRSRYYYEDEAATYDVSLMTAESEQKEFFQKAANISVAYSVSIQTSLSLVTLAQKVEGMVKNNGQMTVEDQAAFAQDLQNLAGVTMKDVAAAMMSESAKKDLIEKIADKVGTSAANLQTRILPVLFGVEL